MSSSSSPRLRGELVFQLCGDLPLADAVLAGDQAAALTAGGKRWTPSQDVLVSALMLEHAESNAFRALCSLMGKSPHQVVLRAAFLASRTGSEGR